MTPRILLEGRPGVGKSTVARRVTELLRQAAVPVSGFTTEEIREGARRVGFRIQTLTGKGGVLAHTSLPGPPRVSKYGVDLKALERLAVPTLTARGSKVVVVDELGKMELASKRFRDAVAELMEAEVPVVATVHAHRHPFTDELKRRQGIELIAVTRANRDQLPKLVADRLRPPLTG